MNLYERDKEILESSAWINNNIIYATQCLLQEQTKGDVFGWQSPELEITVGHRPFSGQIAKLTDRPAICADISSNSLVSRKSAHARVLEQRACACAYACGRGGAGGQTAGPSQRRQDALAKSCDKIAFQRLQTPCALIRRLLVV